MAPIDDDQKALDAMAFQILLHKVTGLEQAVHSLPPLLQKIIGLLEAQRSQPEVPVATYAQLYPGLETAAPAAAPIDVGAETVDVPRPRRRLWHWFLKEGSSWLSGRC